MQAFYNELVDSGQLCVALFIVRLDRDMDAAETIREAVAAVTLLRQGASVDPLLRSAVSEIKHFQSQRFAATYSDLLASAPYRAVVNFFLEELYGDTNYAERDAQFGRIAGGLQRVLPKQAVSTAVALAQLHVLSERLDYAMGRAWLDGSGVAPGDRASRYIFAWRAVASRPEREAQLRLVLEIGADLDRLTRTPGLRTVLRVMHRPAQAAGLGDLQRFLEAGFDTFLSMGNFESDAKDFLAIVQQRESRLLDLLFDADFFTCKSTIDRIM